MSTAPDVDQLAAIREALPEPALSVFESALAEAVGQGAEGDFIARAHATVEAMTGSTPAAAEAEVGDWILAVEAAAAIEADPDLAAQVAAAEA